MHAGDLQGRMFGTSVPAGWRKLELNAGTRVRYNRRDTGGVHPWKLSLRLVDCRVVSFLRLARRDLVQKSDCGSDSRASLELK
jgi:hypothetical protein